MIGRLLYLFFVSLLLVGCASCTPKIDSPGDAFDTNPSDDYSFVTWDDCSQKTGDHPCNFTLKDQNGNDVSLYDFYGETIVLDFSAMWCGPCRAAASEVQEVKDSYKDEGLAYITILIDNNYGEQPSIDDCKDWADTYGINEPVLAGSRSMIDLSSEAGWPIESWPTFYFITDEMVLETSLRGYSSSYIDMLIRDTMGL